MTDFRPSPTTWVRDQVSAIVEAGTTDAASIMGLQVVLLTMTGRRSGDQLKVPLMRVEHDGVYAAVASKGGAPDHPQWYFNLRAHPDITVQDGTVVRDVRAREISGDERAQWWPRCVAAFPQYAEYQARTDRTIPVFLLEPR
ncbi:MAG: nitroreductase family deazaflavin-dependent oxidoreductase [Tetrasphaera sp.]|jgi:deazaflavin-dependent oxidoreductase (nitroreductase family)|nr:nitroreductase family deazaflavin-dependent oxidoreductase [Tetrasphaera sp.]